MIADPQDRLLGMCAETPCRKVSEHFDGSV